MSMWVFRDGEGEGEGGDPLAPVLAGVPEKFHVKQEGAEGIDGLATVTKLTEAYTALEAGRHQSREEVRKELEEEFASSMPKPPESFDAYQPLEALPEGVAFGEDVTIETINDDPLMQLLRHASFAAGVGQEGFTKAATALITEAKRLEEEQTRQVLEGLGEHAEERLGGIAKALTARVGAEAAKEITDNAMSLTTIKALETLVMGDGKGVNNGAGGDLPRPKSRAELEEMMKDVRYWRDHDQRYIAEVAAGFKALTEYERQRGGNRAA